VKSIGDHAFFNCPYLTKIVIPESVVTLEDYSFYECDKLKTVILYGNNLTSIGAHAFHLSPITNFTIPDSVVSIGDYSFCKCSLTNVVLGNSLTSIGTYSFYENPKITNIVIPDSVVSIGNYSFSKCSGLKNITIGNSVTDIGEEVFWQCTSLENLTIPDSVTSIGPACFLGCSALKRIKLSNSLKTISNNMFGHCTQLATITIPDSVISIEKYAFNNCQKLTSITIPDSVESITSTAFQDCKKLSYVFYQGTHDISSNPYDANAKICVSPFYNSSTFCGIDLTVNDTKCEEFQNLFKNCTMPYYSDGSFEEVKNQEAKDWESKTNGCIQYECSNEKGFSAWSMCNSTAEKEKMCIFNECRDKTMEYGKYCITVDIDGVSIVTVNLTEELKAINTITGVNDNSLILSLETDKEGMVIRVILYMDSEDLYKRIAEAINKLDKNNCHGSIICRKKSNNIIDIEEIVSGTNQIHENWIIIMMVLFIGIFAL